MVKEIERKFIINRIPDMVLEYASHYLVSQGYLSIDPEVRIRSVEPIYINDKEGPIPIDDRYLLTIKSNGGLVRDELDISLYADQYERLLSSIPHDMVTKHYYYITIDGYRMELNIVDEGTKDSFIYIEIEFKNEEIAKDYMLPEWFMSECEIVDEVTYDDNYKMKNYWKNTRLQE